jgi:pimeloyl-ACP methyl ester carboxylesterase
VPILIIQGLQDRAAPPENGRLLKAEAPDRVELIELDGAGHALLPEKPVEISGAVTTFLRKMAGSVSMSVRALGAGSATTGRS